MQTEENIEKMKKKRYPLSKQYKDFNLINLSFYTRHCTLESTIFGDPTEEEPNLAYSILKSVKKVSVLALTMFTARYRQPHTRSAKHHPLGRLLHVPWLQNASHARTKAPSRDLQGFR
jgi:hypothetical protein